MKWKIITYAPYYKVSDDGKVFKFKGPKSPLMMTLGTDKDGYKKIELNYKGKRFYKRVHRLVAEAFIPNPNNYPQVNHKNGVVSDNRVDNLEWCTNEYNQIHSWKVLNRKPTHSTDRKCVLILGNRILGVFPSIVEACTFAKSNLNIPYYQLQKYHNCKGVKIEFI